MGKNGRKRGWCGGRRRDWKLRWQNRNIRVVESDDGEVEGDDDEVQGHLTFDPDTGLYTSTLVGGDARIFKASIPEAPPLVMP